MWPRGLDCGPGASIVALGPKVWPWGLEGHPGPRQSLMWPPHSSCHPLTAITEYLNEYLTKYLTRYLTEYVTEYLTEYFTGYPTDYLNE